MVTASCVPVHAHGDDSDHEDVPSSDPLSLTPEKIAQLKSRIMDDSQPMEKRNRCVFTLCAVRTEPSIDALSECLKSNTCSELLKHEIAYVMGQMKSVYALPTLLEVLEDKSEAIIVRHEAAEALGAIGQKESIGVLTKYLEDPSVEIRETCQIAIDRILYFEKRRQEGKTAEEDEEETSKLFQSVDPAPSSSLEGLESARIEKAKNIMMDTSLSLFDRYRGLFALRDIGSDAAVHAMIDGFSDPSALFRHEVAFVMGQLQSPASKDILTKVLCDVNEHEMVRHEAAEALGAISGEDTVEMLEKHLKDEKGVVRESCSVALDIHHYFNSDQFQYADGLAQ